MTPKEEAARHLRRAIGKSRVYGIGWLLAGDDEVVQALRDFDAAWGLDPEKFLKLPRRKEPGTEGR